MTNGGKTTGSIESLDSWVTHAALLPVAFAQVREDPQIDLALVQAVSEKPAVLMIASGGCTAAYLAASAQVRRLHLVDVNPAQMILARLKLRLLETVDSDVRLAILGHRHQPSEQRKSLLEIELGALASSRDALGPLDLVAEVGPDHCGRYEFVFRQLRAELADLQEEIESVLKLRDPSQQSRLVQPTTELGSRLDAAFDKTMGLENLVALFGPRATSNRRQPFSRHFAERTRHVLSTLPAADNPFLWQLFAGRFPTEARYDWLGQPRTRLPAITCAVAPMTEALAATKPDEFDIVHLSNILDWLDPAEGEQLLALAARALRSGGHVLIRQLNSQLDIRAIQSGFKWCEDISREWHSRDRSFFYRQLHVGRKR